MSACPTLCVGRWRRLRSRWRRRAAREWARQRWTLAVRMAVDHSTHRHTSCQRNRKQNTSLVWVLNSWTVTVTLMSLSETEMRHNVRELSIHLFVRSSITSLLKNRSQIWTPGSGRGIILDLQSSRFSTVFCSVSAQHLQQIHALWLEAAGLSQHLTVGGLWTTVTIVLY